MRRGPGFVIPSRMNDLQQIAAHRAEEVLQRLCVNCTTANASKLRFPMRDGLYGIWFRHCLE
jgi:hypothetical protein